MSIQCLATRNQIRIGSEQGPLGFRVPTGLLQKSIGLHHMFKGLRFMPSAQDLHYTHTIGLTELTHLLKFLMRTLTKDQQKQTAVGPQQQVA